MMKIKKMISAMFAAVLMMALCFTTSNSFAQNKKHSKMMMDGCMMKDSMMMCMKEGNTMTMRQDMTMKNGTKCMTTGECTISELGDPIALQQLIPE